MTILTEAEARTALNLTASISDLDRAIIQELLPQIDGAIQKVLFYDPQYKQVQEWHPRANLENLGTSLSVWDANPKYAYEVSLNRSTVLQLGTLPVRAITEVKVDYVGGFGQKPSTFGSDRIWTPGIQYFVDLIAQGQCATGHLYALTGWPREPGSVKVTYMGGYLPEELSGRATSGPHDGDVAINASGIKKAASLTLIKAFKVIKANAKSALAGITGGPIISERLGAYNYALSEQLLRQMAGMVISVPAEAMDDLQPFVNWGAQLL